VSIISLSFQFLQGLTWGIFHPSSFFTLPALRYSARSAAPQFNYPTNKEAVFVAVNQLKDEKGQTGE
tara:strand:- start:1010 stop:1210 length:201 start_codon:yes stop_codon:yes gene_type:complete